MHLIQGWSLDPTHPCFPLLTPSHLLSGQSPTLPQDEASYIQTHTTKLLTYPPLPTHPNGESVLHKILSQPHLSTSEDALLQHVLSFVAARLSLPPVTRWSDEDAITARPLLRRLIALLRTDGLDVPSLVRLEEMALLGEEDLLRIFRAKALCETSGRGRAVVVEGPHPEDGEVHVTEVVTGGDACVVEFDRRCDVGTWYCCLDRGCENVFVQWEGMWRGGRSVRVVRIPAGRFFVVAKGRRWGWKLFAVPVE